MDKTPIDNAIAEMCESALRAKKAAQAIGSFVKKAKVRRFIEVCEAMSGDTISYYAGVYGATMYVTMSVRKLSGMKDPRLEGILSTFAHMEPDDMKTEDYAAGRRRDFKFKWQFKEDDTFVNVNIDVEASIVEDSTTCRQEIIGYTADSPKPIYKLVCDESPDFYPDPDGPGADGLRRNMDVTE